MKFGIVNLQKTPQGKYFKYNFINIPNLMGNFYNCKLYLWQEFHDLGVS